MKLKKLFVLLLCMILIFTMVACGGDDSDSTANNDEKDTQTNVSADNTSDESVTSENNKEDEEETDRISRKLPYTPIYYDYASEYIVRKETADIVMSVNADTGASEIMIGVFCDVLDEFDGALEDVMTYVQNSTFNVALTQAGSGGIAYGLAGEEITITSSEKVTMAGYDSIKYVGTIVNSPFDDDMWNCSVYGYTFLIDDEPYAVIGFVTTREQEQSMIDEMIAEVDAIADSIRTEE